MYVGTSLLKFHPCGDSIAHIFLEGNTEGAITIEATLFGELHGCKGLRRSDAFVIQANEMFNAQTVNVSIVGNLLLSKVTAEISAVGTKGSGKLLQSKIML